MWLWFLYCCPALSNLGHACCSCTPAGCWCLCLNWFGFLFITRESQVGEVPYSFTANAFYSCGAVLLVSCRTGGESSDSRKMRNTKIAEGVMQEVGG